MKKQIKYKNAPKEIGFAIEEAELVNDFLPAPDQLLTNEDTVKVTLGLSRRSVEFFKKQAKQNHVSYQKMLRKVIDLYTDLYNKNRKAH